MKRTLFFITSVLAMLAHTASHGAEQPGGAAKPASTPPSAVQVRAEAGPAVGATAGAADAQNTATPESAGTGATIRFSPLGKK